MWLFYTGSQLLPMFNPGFYFSFNNYFEIKSSPSVLCQTWMGQNHEGFIYFNLITATAGCLILPLLFKMGTQLRTKVALPSRTISLLRIATVSASHNSVNIA